MVTLGQLLIRIGDYGLAAGIAEQLKREIYLRPRAFGHLLEAEVALAEGRLNNAMDAVRASQDLLPLWDAHFAMARIYLAAGETLSALTEFEALREDGEALLKHHNDMPTFRQFAEIDYWIGRAHEARQDTLAAKRAYNQFLQRRDLGRSDPQAAHAEAYVRG